MKKIFFALLLLYSSICAHAQQQILGKWYSQDKKGITEIYAEKGKYYGKVVWLKEPNDKNGHPLTDSENPDKSKRSEPLINLVILKDFNYRDNQWKEGTVYDPTEGKRYKCMMWLKDNNTLMLRGYWGIFHQTETWTRAQ
ncbi:MAG TPA: DUF2147 domain-containing protein [Chitinophaga sp.]|uniref:DUF2147 domain-containing protein n=1 Tax=Chitinophaga sp. TaxID=1869181 RepID=UPI002B68C9BD|nr:DUF2147 domain-containing protein [Chitinophaga sp.]HVI45163.1 DUF2147 domain-containing protein [Chitinophaga sp.]